MSSLPAQYPWLDFRTLKGGPWGRAGTSSNAVTARASLAPPRASGAGERPPEGRRFLGEACAVSSGAKHQKSKSWYKQYVQFYKRLKRHIDRTLYMLV